MSAAKKTKRTVEELIHSKVVAASRAEMMAEAQVSGGGHASGLPETVSVRALHLQLEAHRLRIDELQTELTALRTAHYACPNARLGAAAPEMLEALEHVERLLFHGENPGENGEGYATHLDLVRAVLAKARGEG